MANTPNLWGMFVSAGYLTVTKSIDALNDQYRVEIPNKEIRKEVLRWFYPMHTITSMC